MINNNKHQITRIGANGFVNLVAECAMKVVNEITSPTTCKVYTNEDGDFSAMAGEYLITGHYLGDDVELYGVYKGFGPNKQRLAQESAESVFERFRGAILRQVESDLMFNTTNDAGYNYSDLSENRKLATRIKMDEAAVRRSIRTMLLREWMDDMDYRHPDAADFCSCINLIITYPAGEFVRFEDGNNTPNLEPGQAYIKLCTTDFPDGKARMTPGDNLTPPMPDDDCGPWGGSYEVEDSGNMEGAIGGLDGNENAIVDNIKATHYDEMARAFEENAE